MVAVRMGAIAWKKALRAISASGLIISDEGQMDESSPDEDQMKNLTDDSESPDEEDQP